MDTGSWGFWRLIKDFPVQVCDVWRLLANADIKMGIRHRKKNATCGCNIFLRCKKEECEKKKKIGKPLNITLTWTILTTNFRWSIFHGRAILICSYHFFKNHAIFFVNRPFYSERSDSSSYHRKSADPFRILVRALEVGRRKPFDLSLCRYNDFVVTTVGLSFSLVQGKEQ